MDLVSHRRLSQCLRQQKLSPKSNTLHVWNLTLLCRIFNTCTFFGRRWNTIRYLTCYQCRSKIERNHGVAYLTVIYFKVSLKTCKNDWISDTYRHLKRRHSDELKCQSHGKTIEYLTLTDTWRADLPTGWSVEGMAKPSVVFWKELNIRWERCWSFNKTIGTSLEKLRLVVELTKKYW